MLRRARSRKAERASANKTHARTHHDTGYQPRVAPLPGRHRSHAGVEQCGDGAALRSNGDSRERQGGKKEGEEAGLTLGTLETTAREEGARGGRNRDGDGRPAVRKERAARAAPATPGRFLSPGDVGEQGEDDEASDEARRALHWPNRRRTHSARVRFEQEQREGNGERAERWSERERADRAQGGD